MAMVHWLVETHAPDAQRVAGRYEYLCKTPAKRFSYTKDRDLVTCKSCKALIEESLDSPKWHLYEAVKEESMGWDNVGEGGGGNVLKLEAGKSTRLHVLSEEPFSFWNYFDDKEQKGYIVTDEAAAANPGKYRRQHALVVFDMVTKEAKLWVMGNQVAGELKNIWENYEGLSTIDISLKREGTGLKTKYKVVPVPTKFTDDMIEGIELPNPEETFAAGDEEPATEEFPAEEETPAEEPAAEEEPAPEEEAPAEEPAAEEEPTAEEAPEEEPAPVPARKAAPKPVAKAPAKPAPAADPRMTLIRQVMHKLATTPKFKDAKVKLAVFKKVSKKTIVSQMSIEELKKLLPLIK